MLLATERERSRRRYYRRRLVVAARRDRTRAPVVGTWALGRTTGSVSGSSAWSGRGRTTGWPVVGSLASASVRTSHSARAGSSALVHAGKTAAPDAGSSASGSVDRSHPAAAGNSARVRDRTTAATVAARLAAATARTSHSGCVDSSAWAHAGMTACLDAASARRCTKETTASAAASPCGCSLAAAAADTRAGARAGTSRLVDADRQRRRRDRTADRVSSGPHREAPRFPHRAQSGRHHCTYPRPTCATTHRCEESRIRASPIRRRRDPCRPWSRRACSRPLREARGTRVHCRVSQCRRAGPRAIRWGLPLRCWRRSRCAEPPSCRPERRRDYHRGIRMVRTVRDPRRSRRVQSHAERRRAEEVRRARSPLPSIDRPPHDGHRRRRD